MIETISYRTVRQAKVNCSARIKPNIKVNLARCIFPYCHSMHFFTVDDFEAHATRILPPMVRDYYNGGSMDAVTLRANRDAYSRYHIRPRVLRNVSDVQTATSCFQGGNTLPFPLCIAPAAMQRMAHAEGEEAMVRAAARFGTVMGLSTFSTSSLEDVSATANAAREHSGQSGPAECVLQLYLFQDRDTSLDLLRRAEKAGFKAVVLTVDTPQFGRRLSELRNQFRVPSHLRMANFSNNVRTGSELRTMANSTNNVGVATSNKNDPSLTWEAVDWLKSKTSLPIWLKGIMTEEDAELAIQHSADAIVLSNHGGRQLDGAPSTLDMLPAIAKTIRGRVPLHFDGGVRRGSDIFKALCLGADMVWIGRPALWALACNGEEGVIQCLELLFDEFKACMALAGYASLHDLNPSCLMWRDSYGKLSKL